MFILNELKILMSVTPTHLTDDLMVAVGQPRPPELACLVEIKMAARI